MKEQACPKKTKAFQIVLSLLFLGMLWLPLAGMVLPIAPDWKLDEKRIPAELPTIGPYLKGLCKFPAQFDRYYRDHFGLRPFMVYTFNLLRSCFEGMEIANQVITGKKGWYFITTDNTLDDYRGLIRLTPTQLAKIKATLEKRRNRLEAMGSRFLLLIAPAKWELYPEYMPDFYSRISRDSTLNQVYRYLEHNSDIDLIDLRPALLQAKENCSIYDGLDTHWSEMGAFVVAQESIKRMKPWFPDIKTDTLSDYTVLKSIKEGDLAALMGLNESLKRDTQSLIRNGSYGFQTDYEGDLNIYGGQIRYSNSPALPDHRKVLVFHDSFGAVLRSFIPVSFQESLFIWEDYLDYGQIERERPDVVIQEVGQRNMIRKLMSDSD